MNSILTLHTRKVHDCCGTRTRKVARRHCLLAMARRNSGIRFSPQSTQRLNFDTNLLVPKFIHATGLGLEPRYHPPEGCVLPLDDPAMIYNSDSLDL